MCQHQRTRKPLQREHLNRLYREGVTYMKQKSRLLPLVAMIVIALVIGSLVLRQVSLRPHEDLLPTASPSPTSEITPDINITMGAEAALLSQGVGNALQETAEGANTTLI